MEQWQRLAQNYINDEVQRETSFAMNVQDNILSIRGDIRFPVSIEFRNILYLAYGRNAWQSTWVNKYYPGSISVLKSSLQKLAEKRRVQGSVFRIESRSALLLKFKNRSLVLTAINRGRSSTYSKLLSEVKSFDLQAFWWEFCLTHLDEDPNLIVLNLVDWRPDLWPQNDFCFEASSRGINKNLVWTRANNDRSDPLFNDFRKKFSEEALSLK